MSKNWNFVEMMNNWSFSVNARKNFIKCINDVETEDGLIEAVHRICQIIDDIVLKKEVS